MPPQDKNGTTVSELTAEFGIDVEQAVALIAELVLAGLAVECKLGCEGIVSKRLGSPYRSGRSPHWGQGQKSECARREAGGRGGLGPVRTVGGRAGLC
jgi:hypothetical protein